VERSWGVLGEGAGRDLIITVGTMVPVLSGVTISSFVVPLGHYKATDGNPVRKADNHCHIIWEP